tara:strand:+ start:266 stop:709 length:444 start_codon:yes stop_codon:yes gene_type:complete
MKIVDFTFDTRDELLIVANGRGFHRLEVWDIESEVIAHKEQLMVFNARLTLESDVIKSRSLVDYMNRHLLSNPIFEWKDHFDEYFPDTPIYSTRYSSRLPKSGNNQLKSRSDWDYLHLGWGHPAYSYWTFEDAIVIHRAPIIYEKNT